MKIYDSITNIPIFNFYKVLETDDYSYLYKKKSLRGVKSNSKELFSLWVKIYDEYVLKTDDKTTQNHFILINEVHYLQKRYEVIKTVIESISEYNKNVFGNILKEFNVIFNQKDTVKNQMESLKRQLRAATNKLNRKNSELQLIKEESSEINLIKEKVQIEQVIKSKIDIYNDTMEEFIEIKNIANDILKQQRKSVRNV
jgi:hypothetical protein